jgi:hypothetical protein
VYKLKIEFDAQADLKKMIEAGGDEKEYAVMLLAFLDELSKDQRWLDFLLVHRFENDHFNISKYVEFKESHDIWRIKVFEWDASLVNKWPIPYRIIYAYDSPCSTFRILAIVNRNTFDYENDNPITQRVLKQYGELGLKIHNSFSTWRAGRSRH